MIRTGIPLKDLNSDEVRSLQQLLIQLGYNPGPVDGAMGPQTQSAYARFLAANGNGDPNIVDSGIAALEQRDPDIWAVIRTGNEMVAPVVQAPAPATAAAPPPGAAGGGAPAVPAAPLASSQPYVAPAQGATDAEIRRLFPQLAYLLDQPEIGGILRQAAAEGWDAARLQGALYTTSYWQTTSAAIRTWDNAMAQDPATANAKLEQKSTEIIGMMARYGVQAPEADWKWLAGRVLREGWSDDQLLRFVGGLVRDGHGLTPGKITEEQRKIRALARSYMVNMNDNDVREWSARIAEGTASADAVESHLRKEAGNRFTWLRTEIDAGLTPEQLFSPNRNAVAQLLEMNPDTMDLNDVRWSALTAPIVGTDGKQRSMNFYEAQQWARSQADWRYTQNANKESSDLELSVLRALGAIA